MAFVYTIIDGKRVNTAAAQDYWRMEAAFRNAFGLDLIVSDGVRTYAEQKRLWDDYTSGRSSVRAANPDSSQAYHVETNPKGARALDIRDSGGDAGVTRYGNARSNWIRDHARDYNFDARGYREFNEPWHIEWQGTLATDGGSPAGSVPGVLDVDGKLGGNTIRKLQSVLGANPDGEFGPNSIRALQTRLGFTGGDVDGDLGPKTISAMQVRLGFTGNEVDGDWGEKTTRRLQEHLNAGGTLAGTPPVVAPPVTAPAQLKVDGDLGLLTIKRLQESLGFTGADVDGDWGSKTTSALQGKIGARVDGELGPQTIKAIQLNVGLTGTDVDGSLGPVTVTKLQEFLNSGKPWQIVAVTPEAPVTDFLVTPRAVTFPAAAFAWNVPFGQEKRVGGKVTTYIVHHETAFVSQVPYFKARNERGVAPSFEVDGKIVTELAHPALKPSATGSANDYSIASETVNTGGEPDWKVAQDSLESHAQIAAWMAQQDFVSAPDGTVVDFREFTLDRQHVIGHKEAGVNATRCPGEYQMAHMDWIVERAKAIVAAGTVIPPVEPEVPANDAKKDEIYDLLEQAARKIEAL